MQKLAKLMGLMVKKQSSSFFPFFKKISYLSGNIRNKEINVFYNRSSKFPTRIVAQINLKKINPIKFSASRKRLGYNLLKALGHCIILSQNLILDRKILFQSNDQFFAKEVFKYEEICDKFDTLFSYKLNNGIISIGESSIFYYEMAGFLTKKRRERFVIAIDLLCDLFDVLYFSNRGPHD